MEVVGLVVVDERVVVVDLVVIVVVALRVEEVDEDYLIKDLVRFDGTIGQTLIVDLERQSLELLDHTV